MYSLNHSFHFQILKLNQDTKDTLVYMYLFIGVDGQHLDESINHHLAQSELWKKLTIQNNNTITSCNMNTGNGAHHKHSGSEILPTSSQHLT